MADLRGVLGLAVLLLVAWLLSKDRRGVSWRTVGVALALQVGFAVLVLRWGPGERALGWVSERVESLIGYANEGTAFVFGPLLDVGEEGSTIFALQVLPVIIFLGTLIGLLYYLRVIQWTTYLVGGALSKLLGIGKVESLYAGTVVFLGMSEAPLMVQGYLGRLRQGQVFAIMTAGFAAAAGSTLVGYSLLGAPLEYLLAATVMNAPASILMAKLMWPDSVAEPEPEPEPDPDADQATHCDRDGAEEIDVRDVRDQESANVIDALSRGAMAGGRIAVTVGALLIAFVAVIALANGILGGVGGWFGAEDLTFEKILGWAVAPLAWLLGVPWSEAADAGSWIGQKTVLNEFVAYADFGPQVGDLSPVTVAVVTFALAGFANFSSIAIQIGALGSLMPERRAMVARLGLRALLAGSLANLANAAIAGVVVGF
ncbi:NupC/NupG family nucleoside CNT transporter [Nocardioides dongxiaopingii]|uniref:NupC/NupG family nucleoside CNT transporter n=1 Tax=Nocardioides dongxiaopingii TaxID=2576036 RepID=UPI0010C76C56|nr:nucleoside transporter C-terminal domain-containing protein [Nocardioides dongxiaopingii]